ncbi:hypothetical protein SCUCBS95973_002029 [Sporothrix curviconia]|uniref:F-box domain-containing protein n=1 Tax=Sporothrix curviconia TaxID=1260050 RepID=A0ABP0B4E1_9PEZI
MAPWRRIVTSQTSSSTGSHASMRPDLAAHRLAGHAPSSLGRLDCLPAELLRMVVHLLDCQSLVRLGQTSRGAWAIVDGLPAYRELRQHVLEVLAALGRTRMLRHHSVLLLQEALRSSLCASCQLSFGGFLLLPTCERVCFDCLYENRALWMTTLGNARACFRLTQRQLETQLPVLHTIPGFYGVQWHKHHPKIHRLVNVRQAKELAVKIHGSVATVAAFLPAVRPPGMSHRKYHMFRSFHEASLEPPGRELTLLPTRANMLEDDCGGVASVRMPYLCHGQLNRGRTCRFMA